MSELREELKDRAVEGDNMPGRLELDVTSKGVEISVSTLSGKVLSNEVYEFSVSSGSISFEEVFSTRERDVSAHMGIETALEDVIYHAGKLSREFWEASDE